MAAENITAFFLSAHRGPDAINWNGKAADVPHSAIDCMHPPPFGQQCTTHASNALFACLRAQPACHALSCPSPEPYQHARGRSDSITNAICQLRSEQLEPWLKGSSRARRHGMCNFQGCRNFFLTRVMIHRMPGGRRAPRGRYELIIAAPDQDAEQFLGLRREVAASMPAHLIEFGDHTHAAGGLYFAYAVDKSTPGRVLDLATLSRSLGQKSWRDF